MLVAFCHALSTGARKDEWVLSFNGDTYMRRANFSWAEDDILPGDFSMEEILEERLGDLGIPLVLNLPLGHGHPNNALPLGAMAQLDGRRGNLSLIR